ncbi:hypothetical protein GCM10020220_042140 [Nonomuraea rubra]
MLGQPLVPSHHEFSRRVSSRRGPAVTRYHRQTPVAPSAHIRRGTLAANALMCRTGQENFVPRTFPTLTNHGTARLGQARIDTTGEISPGVTVASAWTATTVA